MERKQNAVAIAGAFLAQAILVAAIGAAAGRAASHQGPVPMGQAGPGATFLVPAPAPGPVPYFEVGVNDLAPLPPGPAALSPLGSPQPFTVTPGEHLTITVAALLPD